MGMKYTIGEVSKLSGLPIDTLRYYDKIRLLKPLEVNKDTNYRYYDESQLWNIEVIRTLRKVEVSIKNIHKLMELRDDLAVIDEITERLNDAEVILKKYKSMVKDLRWMRDECIRLRDSKITGIIEKTIKEREVIYNSLEDQSNSMLHIYSMQNQLTEAGMESIRRRYGYILDDKAFYHNEYLRKGEYLYLVSGPDKKNAFQRALLPQGKYVCQVTKVERIPGDASRKGIMDVSDLCRYVNSKGLRPKLILAEEIGVPMFNFQKLNYEIQVLVD